MANGNGTSLRILSGIALYTAIIGFCLAVWAGTVWLYLDHTIWFFLAAGLVCGLIVALCWDDLFMPDDREIEQPKLRRVV